VWRRLGQLPPALFQTSVTLRYHLAAQFSDNCLLEDIFTRPIDYPWLDLAHWLLDDLGVSDTSARRQFERRLFAAVFFDLAARFLRESSADPHSAFDHTAQPLAQVLAQWAARAWRALLPGYGALRETCADEYAATWRARVTSAWPPRESPPATGLLAPAKLIGAAVAVFTQKTDELGEWLTWFETVHPAAQLCADLYGLRRDLQLRRATHPIARAAQAAGWVEQTPDQLLGTLIFKDLVAPLVEEATTPLAACGVSAQARGWPTLAQWVSTVTQETRSLAAALSLRPAPTSPTPPRPLLAAGPEGLPTALMLAERYLTADRTLRDAWEFQRWGLFGEAEVISRTFPTGLVFELLARHRLAAPRDLEAWLTACVAEDFRYFDHAATPPDADTIGLALRLLPAIADPTPFYAGLTEPVRWMQFNQRPDGLIPCWLARAPGRAPAAEVGGVWWEAECGAVEAHILLGLLAHDALAPSAMIEGMLARAIPGWLTRMAASGVGRVAYYAVAYGLWRSLELLAQLRPHAEFSAAAPLRQRVENDLTAYLQRALRVARPSPQTAAWLALAAHHTPLTPPAEWRTLILKAQRSDGCWPAEPLYITPMYGRKTSWYASQMMTTAYIYHALKLWDTEKLINDVLIK
jgi:hypothetical protein